MKIIRHLKAADLLTSERGPQGGYRIKKSPSEITLYDIVTIMEGEICINKCIGESGFCSRNAKQYCQIHFVMNRLQTDFCNTLKNYTLNDFVSSFN